MQFQNTMHWIGSLLDPYFKTKRTFKDFWMTMLKCFSTLGKPVPTKTDEFSEKFQTAFDPPPLIFGKSCCRFFKKLYSLKNHTCGIFLKSPGYESIKNNDPCCQIQSLNFKFWGFTKAVTGAALEAIWKLSEQSMFIYRQFVVRGTVLWDAGAPA